MAAEVVSSNIVGYNKVTLTSGYNLIGSQFVNIGQDTQDINELFPGSNTLPGLDANGDFQSTLLVWSGSGYATYGWMNATDGTDAGDDSYNSKWVLQDFSDFASVDMTPGMGFWIQSSGDAEATFSGEVPEGDSVDIQLAAGYNLISHPFPEAISIQAVQSDDLLGLDANGDFQSTIQIWTGSGYAIYGWMNATDGTDAGDASYNSKWVLQDFSDIANVTIGIGKGFWIQTPAAATVTLSK